MDYVFVHGTTQSPAAWRPAEDLLHRRGHRTVAVDLPTDRPELGAVDYAAIARAQAGDALAPVAVGHSGAGLRPDPAPVVDAPRRATGSGSRRSRSTAGTARRPAGRKRRRPCWARPWPGRP